MLKNRYRCVAYDHRGQGRSADDIGRAISMETVTEDAVALIEKLGLGPVHFCGLSLGGIVDMRLAVGRPDLIRSLVLLDTTADEEPYKLKYQADDRRGPAFGVRFVARAVMPALFGKTTLNDPARADERAQWMQQLIMNRSSIWRAANGVLERKSIYGELGKIVAPTLVMVGDGGCEHAESFGRPHRRCHSAREAYDHSRRRSRLDVGAAGDRHRGDRRIPGCAKRAGGGTAQRGGGLIFVI